MSSWPRNSALAVSLALAATWAAADPTIEITALRHPVDKSYRRMVKGMDLFDRLHAMAPEAALRYKLLLRKRGTDIDGIVLHIVGDKFDMPVAVAADHTFTLGRYQKALAEDAAVRSERRAESMTWRAEIRTPGLPPGTRRLGDLRLECQVGMEAGLVSHYPSALGRLIERLLDSPDFCNGAYAPYLFFADRPIFGVSLTAGDRRQRLSVGRLYAGVAHGKTPEAERRYCDCEALLDRAYTLPLGDRSWPDDTLVRLEYMDTAGDDPNDAILVGSSKAEVSAAFGKAAVVRFDSGYEVWAYQYDPQRQPLARTELVVLFAPSGVVTKTRLRVAPPSQAI